MEIHCEPFDPSGVKADEIPERIKYFAEWFNVPVLYSRPIALNRALLCCLSSITPGHQLVEAFDPVAGDLCENPNEPGPGIDFVEPGGLDEGIGNCHGLAAAFGTGKHPVLSPDSIGQWFRQCGATTGPV